MEFFVSSEELCRACRLSPEPRVLSSKADRSAIMSCKADLRPSLCNSVLQGGPSFCNSVLQGGPSFCNSLKTMSSFFAGLRAAKHLGTVAGART